MIQCTRKFRSTSTKEEFIMHCTVTCETENIIYLLECAICDLQYIGQTKRKLKIRMNEHRSDSNNRTGFSLSRHLNSTNHHNAFDKLKVTIIEHNPNWDNESRLERERFWIRKFKTFSPICFFPLLLQRLLPSLTVYISNMTGVL